MKHRSSNPNKWRIEPGTDIITGHAKWFVTPPRFVYNPHAGGKRSFDTYDEALALIRTSTGGRRPLVFESKTHTGHWFWLSPDGASGWEKDRATAHNKANGTHQEEAA